MINKKDFLPSIMLLENQQFYIFSTNQRTALEYTPTNQVGDGLVYFGSMMAYFCNLLWTLFFCTLIISFKFSNIFFHLIWLHRILYKLMSFKPFLLFTILSNKLNRKSTIFVLLSPMYDCFQNFNVPLQFINDFLSYHYH